jgi:hypothetical protein
VLSTDVEENKTGADANEKVIAGRLDRIASNMVVLFFGLVGVFILVSLVFGMSTHSKQDTANDLLRTQNSLLQQVIDGQSTTTLSGVTTATTYNPSTYPAASPTAEELQARFVIYRQATVNNGGQISSEVWDNLYLEAVNLSEINHPMGAACAEWALQIAESTSLGTVQQLGTLRDIAEVPHK